MRGGLKKATLWVVIGLVAGLVGVLGLLRHYELDLVQQVVVHALIQKAAHGYPRGEIEQVFEMARTRAEAEGREDEFLGVLFSLSQRLEKIQRLDRRGIDEVLAHISQTGS